MQYEISSGGEPDWIPEDFLRSEHEMSFDCSDNVSTWESEAERNPYRRWEIDEDPDLNQQTNAQDQEETKESNYGYEENIDHSVTSYDQEREITKEEYIEQDRQQEAREAVHPYNTLKKMYC